MKVYRIRSDPQFHALFPLDCDPMGLTHKFDAEEKWDTWVSAFGAAGPRFGVWEPLVSKRGNFFGLSSGVLVHDMQVADDADRLSLFQSDIEYLPGRLGGTGEALCLQNITGCYNCLDLKESIVLRGGDGNISSVKTHVFLPNRILDSTLFKIPETRFDTIYALSGRGQEDFFEFYQEHGYRGLIFDEIWNG